MVKKTINGTTGSEWLYGQLTRKDIVDGFDGLEIHALGGNDGVDGTALHDVLYGDDGNDQLHGNDGNDTLYGGAGNVSLYGEQGIDVLQDFEGANVFFGGA